MTTHGQAWSSRLGPRLRGHRFHACVVIETSMGGASPCSSPHLLQPLATTGPELGTESFKFHSHWLPQAPNSEPKAATGHWRRRARWGETDMSEGAGLCHVSRRGRVLVCCPHQAPRRKARVSKRAGSAQPLA